MDEVNKLSGHVQELKTKLESAASLKSENTINVKEISLIINLLEKFNDTFDFIDDIKQKRIILSSILDEVRWDGDNFKAKIEFIGSKKK